MVYVGVDNTATYAAQNSCLQLKLWLAQIEELKH